MNHPSYLLVALGVVLTSQPARSCFISVPLNVSDVKFADVVLIGRVANYHIVRDMAFRRKMLATADLPRDLRSLYKNPKGKLLGDYAQFDVLVGEVLKGRAAKRITVTWDNSTFGEPDTMIAGPFLIALRRSGSGVPPLRGPSATVLPNPEPKLLTVLQAPCAGAFMFASGSATANAVRRTLITGSK